MKRGTDHQTFSSVYSLIPVQPLWKCAEVSKQTQTPELVLRAYELHKRKQKLQNAHTCDHN